MVEFWVARDGLHWQTDLISYLLIGGSTDYDYKAGKTYLRLRYRDNAKTWDLGLQMDYGFKLQIGGFIH